MSMLKGTIELTKYVGATIEQRMFMGEEVDCISIPIEINGLWRRSKDRIYLSFVCFDRRPNTYRITHTISPRMSDKKKELLKQMGFYENMRYVGKLSNFNNKYWVDRPDDGRHIPIEVAMRID